jgi:hypothetical protein
LDAEEVALRAISLKATVFVVVDVLAPMTMRAE